MQNKNVVKLKLHLTQITSVYPNSLASAFVVLNTRIKASKHWPMQKENADLSLQNYSREIKCEKLC